MNSLTIILKQKINITINEFKQTLILSTTHNFAQQIRKNDFKQQTGYPNS